MFELAEEALDQVALAIEPRIDRALNFAITLGRNVRLAAPLANQFDNGLGVVAAIGNKSLGWGQSFQQGRDGGFVGGLPG